MNDFAGDVADLSELDLADGLPSRTERRDQQMSRIMDAARSCFVRSGLNGASMQEICAEAGMSPGALYRYFPSKESIIEAISEEHRRQDAEIFGGMAAAGGTVIDVFVSATMKLLRRMHESGDAPLLAEIRAETIRNPGIRATCDLAMQEAASAFLLFLARNVEEGSIRPVVPLASLIPSIVALGEGLAINDVASQGVPMEHVETLVRAMAVAILRPVDAD